MTLTELTYYARKMAPFAVLGVIVLLIGYYSFQLLFLLIDLNRQPEQEAVVAEFNTVFETIPQPYIEDYSLTEGYSFVLDTVEGVPLTPTDRAEVYFLPASTASFGFRERVYVMAKTLGINTELVDYELFDNKVARFQDRSQRLIIDIRNYNFQYEYTDLSREDQRLANAIIPSEEKILDEARDVMNQVGRYPGELAQGRVNIIYLAYNPQTDELTVVDSPESANLVEVDYYRPDVGDYPIVPPNYYNSPNYVIMLFNEDEMNVVRAQVRFHEKSEDQVGVYPIITGDEAFARLQNGQGWIVSGGGASTDIAIKKMFVGYLDPAIYQEYLGPVYVFLGNDNFVAYVPAITDEWYSEPEEAPENVFKLAEDSEGSDTSGSLEDMGETEDTPETSETDQSESPEEQSEDEVVTTQSPRSRDVVSPTLPVISVTPNRRNPPSESSRITTPTEGIEGVAVE